MRNESEISKTWHHGMSEDQMGGKVWYFSTDETQREAAVRRKMITSKSLFQWMRSGGCEYTGFGR